jgi:pimeloyl-ACP methyl ester carboxylesterase
MMSPARPRLLLVHGLPGSLSYFAPRRYLPGVNVSTLDLVGWGRHRSEETGITLAGQAAMLARFLRDAAGKVLARFLRDAAGKVLGHGVGGAIAMLLADLAPDLVRGLISVEGTTR